MSVTDDTPAAPEVQPSAQPARNPYIVCPYDGEILPGTAEGSKLYLNATKSVDEEKRFALTIENALTIKSQLAQAAQKFGWSSVVTIPISYNAAGEPLTMNNLTMNPEQINLEATCFHGAVAFGKPNYTTLKFPDMNAVDIDPFNVEEDRDRFQLRVRLDMLAKYIYGHFDEAAIKTVELKSSLFTWKNSDGSPSLDGATMLKVIMDEISPSTIVGTEGFRRQIQGARLAKYGYNVKTALEAMEHAYKEIIRRGETYDSFRYHIFDCLISAKNSDFVTWTKRAQQDISSGTGEYKEFTAQMILESAKKMYMNMIATGDWDKVDPRDAQMIALLTSMKAATVQKTNVFTPGKPTSTAPSAPSITRNSYEEWQLPKVGDTKIMNGKTWWWCPQHNEGKGLYVRHPPGDHAKWLHSKRNRSDPDARYIPPDVNPPSGGSAHATTGSANPPAASHDIEAIKLTLGDNLKQILCTYGLSDTDTDTAWSQSLARSGLN